MKGLEDFITHTNEERPASWAPSEERPASRAPKLTQRRPIKGYVGLDRTGAKREL